MIDPNATLYTDSACADSACADSASYPPSNNAPSKKVVLLSAIYGLLFLLMLILAYQGTLPVSRLSRFHSADKIGHLILYFIPSYLGHILCRYKHLSSKRLLRWRFPLFPTLFTLFTITEELIQGFSVNRTLDAGDMVCSLVGIAAGYWLAQRKVAR